MAGIPDGYKDILQKKAFANLATVSTDGSPQVTPVWVDYDGTHIRFNTAKGRVKDQNLRRNPAVALSILDPDNPYRYLQVRGRVAEITDTSMTFVTVAGHPLAGSVVFRFVGIPVVDLRFEVETVDRPATSTERSRPPTP